MSKDTDFGANPPPLSCLERFTDWNKNRSIGCWRGRGHKGGVYSQLSL